MALINEESNSFADTASTIVGSRGKDLSRSDVNNVDGVLVFFGDNNGYAFIGNKYTSGHYQRDLNSFKRAIKGRGFQVTNLLEMDRSNMQGFEFRRHI